jgi:hypothetical protein
VTYDDSGLRRLQENLEGLSETHRVPLTSKLSPAFMQHHTQFASFEAMLAASPFPVESAEDFTAIPDDEWDAFVRHVTRFHSWEEMQKEAGVEWVKQQLLKGIK